MTDMTEKTNTIQLPHSVALEDRKKLELTGVTDVDSFDETAIIAYTSCGELTISGTQLHISKLNTEQGQLDVEGNISALIYTDQQPKSNGFFGKIFR